MGQHGMCRRYWCQRQSPMNLDIETYAYGHSPLHRWEPRCKLVGLLALMVAFAFVRSPWLLPVILVVALAIYRLARLPLLFLLARLRLPGLFVLFLVMSAPFLIGHTVVVAVGPLALRQEGLMFVGVFSTRFVAILTAGVVLFSTAPLAASINAARSLGVPVVLTEMTLLTYRYLHELGRDLHTMQRAMGQRGFRASRLRVRTLSHLAALTGSLLVRSFERSERVYQAMRLRGYGVRQPGASNLPVGWRDALALVVALVIAAGLVAVDLRLRA